MYFFFFFPSSCFFFPPTRMLTVDSLWAYTSASKCETFYYSVSADVPRILKTWSYYRLESLKLGCGWWIKFQRNAFFIHLAADDTFSTLYCLSVPKNMLWFKHSKHSHGGWGDQLDGGDSEELGRGNRSPLRPRGRQRLRKMGVKRKKCQWRWDSRSWRGEKGMGREWWL